MKSAFILGLSLCFLSNDGTSQGICTNSLKIETPAVAKPTDGTIASASCTALVVQWKGTADQTYVVSGTYRNSATNATGDLPPASDLSCDNAFNCTATLSVTAGTLVNWRVQGVGVIDERTFYSYPLRGAQDYEIPACAVPAVTSNPTHTAVEPQNKIKVNVYPNPANTTLNISIQDIANSVSKKETIRIFDITGKTVLVKQTNLVNTQLNVNKLSNGTYFIRVEDTEGKALYNTKFIKQ